MSSSVGVEVSNGLYLVGKEAEVAEDVDQLVVEDTVKGPVYVISDECGADGGLLMGLLHV